MADEFNPTPRKWSLEEIDELLRDSGIVSGNEDDIAEEVPITKKAESVNPRPTYNENAEHKIKTKKVEKSEVSQSTHVFGALESDKYRERFLNRPVQNLEKTAEHTFSLEAEKYERGGFIKKESSFKGTAELDPVPTIVSDDLLKLPKEDIEKTKTIGLRSLAVTDGNAHETELFDEDDSQLTFEGFNTEEDKLTQVDEAEIEKELIEKRKEKAAEFVLSKESIDTPEEETQKFGIDEYRTVNDKFKVGYFLKKKKKSSLITLVADTICMVVSFGMSFAMSSFDISFEAFPVINFILIALCMAISYNVITDGILNAVKFKFNRNSGIALSAVFSLIYAASLILCNDFSGEYQIYTAAAILPMFFNSLSDYIDYGRIKKNFDVVCENDYYSIGNIDKNEAAFEIGRGLLLDEPHIVSSQKTLFPGRFLELSRKYFPSDELSKRILPIVTAVSLIVGAVALLVTKDVYSALGALSASLCVGIPYFSFLTDAVSISAVSKKALKNGGIISGWQAFKETSSSNALTIEATDIFDREGGNIFGIKTFSSMKIDDAILNTAALVVESGGPLGELFKRVILGKTELLPPVESLAYEDKLGLSAWIQNRRVLVGSVDLLRNHNVEVPDKAFIDRFLHDGRYPLLLAVEGKLAAMFIVSYDISEENAEYIREIERNGLSLLVRADDANITDEMISSNLSVPMGGIKVLSAVSSDIYKSLKKEVRSAADSALMHDGKSETYIKCVSTVLSLGKKKHLSSLVQIGASGIGIAFVAALAFSSGLSSLLCSQLVLTQLIFTGIALLAVKVKK